MGMSSSVVMGTTRSTVMSTSSSTAMGTTFYRDGLDNVNSDGRVKSNREDEHVLLAEEDHKVKVRVDATYAFDGAMRGAVEESGSAARRGKFNQFNPDRHDRFSRNGHDKFTTIQS